MKKLKMLVLIFIVTITALVFIVKLQQSNYATETNRVIEQYTISNGINANDILEINILVPKATLYKYLHKFFIQNAYYIWETDVKLNIHSFLEEEESLEKLNDKQFIEKRFNEIDGDIDIIMGFSELFMDALANKNYLYNIENISSSCSQSFENLIYRPYIDGNLYYFTPAIQEHIFIFTNNDVFNSLGVDNFEKGQQVSFTELKNKIEKLSYSQIIKETKYRIFSIGGPISSLDNFKYFYNRYAGIYGKYIIEYNTEDFEKYNDFMINILPQYIYDDKDTNDFYPMDWFFAKGNTAVKIGNLFELEVFTNPETFPNAPQSLKVKDFNFSVYSGPIIGNKSMIYTNNIAIPKSKIDKISHTEKMINYIMSEEYALKMINKRLFENNLASNYASIPNYHSKFVEDALIRRYKKYENLNIDVKSLFYNKKQYSGKINFIKYDTEHIEKLFEEILETSQNDD